MAYNLAVCTVGPSNSTKIGFGSSAKILDTLFNLESTNYQIASFSLMVALSVGKINDFWAARLFAKFYAGTKNSPSDFLMSPLEQAIKCTTALKKVCLNFVSFLP